MIRAFRHKVLKALYEKNQTRGLNTQWLKRIRAILARLDASKEAAEMDFPGLRLHPLKGDCKDCWAVDVSGNWRIVFRFEDQEPHDVDLVDYH
ncbi:MAG: type II toxin-antitoxin system RelE/ParE family toxin [Geminicoccaceae bacterium]|jgi:proteic killer suppression protein|nr:type II toxin-antitoxin system RelE/ParE family toxin [Geminicoccaceae bacterium]